MAATGFRSEIELRHRHVPRDDLTTLQNKWKFLFTRYFRTYTISPEIR